MQLSVSALMTGAELQQLHGSFAHMVQQLASSGLGCGLQTGILGQLGSQAVLVGAGGSEAAVLDMEHSGAAAPQVRGRSMTVHACMHPWHSHIRQMVPAFDPVHPPLRGSCRPASSPCACAALPLLRVWCRRSAACGPWS